MTFATVLRDTIAARGMSLADVRRATGISESTVHYWLTGDRMPTLAKADHMADVLGNAGIARAAAQALQRRCVRCRRKFYAAAKQRNHTRYCGNTCRQAVARARARRAEPTARRVRVAKMERAIVTFCRECEPDGICRTAECPLRAFSPFPLATH